MLFNNAFVPVCAHHGPGTFSAPESSEIERRRGLGISGNQAAEREREWAGDENLSDKSRWSLGRAE